MKKLNKNPLAWFILIVVFGYIFGVNSGFEGVMVFILALIVSKQIEIINLHGKN